jgi:predicted transcriptional regulator
MGNKPLLRAGLVLLFVLGTSIPIVLAADDNGGYIVTPHTGEYPEGAIVDQTEADANITFWDLPLWIQLSVISGLLIPMIATLKYLPLILGKISTKKQNPQLNSISSYIIENPGCLESEISRDLNFKRGTLRYYLKKLTAQKMITTIKKGKIKSIFHINLSTSTKDKMLQVHIRIDSRKKILDAINNKPGITGQELAFEVGLDKSTVHWHIGELLEDEIIHVEKNGRVNRHYLQDISLIHYKFEQNNIY